MNHPSGDHQDQSSLPLQSELTAKAVELKDLTKELDARILAFENWLSSLPGRADVTVTCTDSEDPDYELHLRLQRQIWKLTCCYARKGKRPTGTDWRNLISASLNAKISAVDAFPDLLVQMQKAQADLIERVRAATAKINRLSESLRPSKVEGE